MIIDIQCHTFFNILSLIKTNRRHCMSRLNEVKNLMAGLEEDLVKFYDKGNKAAGTRARKQLQDLKKLAQDIRVEIQNIKNEG